GFELFTRKLQGSILDIFGGQLFWRQSVQLLAALRRKVSKNFVNTHVAQYACQGCVRLLGIAAFFEKGPLHRGLDHFHESPGTGTWKSHRMAPAAAGLG